MKEIFIRLIRFYQKAISPDQGFFRHLVFGQTKACPLYPSCSEYAIGSIEKHGLVLGLFYSLKRLLRCHPWQKIHIDPVP